MAEVVAVPNIHYAIAIAGPDWTDQLRDQVPSFPHQFLKRSGLDNQAADIITGAHKNASLGIMYDLQLDLGWNSNTSCEAA